MSEETTDLLPPNATDLETALDRTMARIEDVPVPIDTLWRPETCPAEVLPWLAWALSVDHWDSAWPEEIKRRVIAASIAVHRIKGTPAAVRQALAALDLGVDIQEWFEYDGAPYHFKVDVVLEGRGITQAEYDTALASVLATKNARSHLEALRMIFASKVEAPVIGVTCVMGAVNTVYPLKATPPDSKAPLIVAMGVQSVMTATVYSGEAA